MSDYIHELNENQRDAVLYNDGPSLVIAGAGSGKTRVLTYKIAYLLENGYQPWNILALTFTNKAAREMKERIARQVDGESAARLWMGTFHSMFLRILHTEAERLGFTPRFTVYDTADTKSLLRSILKEMGLDEKTYRPAVVLGRISNAKNRLVSPEMYAATREVTEADRMARMPLIYEIYRRYRDRCRLADAMDFDDLLLYTFVLFRDHPEVLAHYRDRFRFILVDEYQDTNFAQHSIVRQLGEVHRHVCVVGDDAQSIYSFRGADIDNILSFTKVFPEAKVFKLERNYRSTQTIVCAANSLIEKNERQIRKEVFSEKEKGEALEVVQAYSDVEEGEIVAGRIADLKRECRCGYGDFAILYRTNAQSRIFEEALRKRGMPYRIYGGLSFYQRKEIKDVIAYFRMMVNPHDEEALKRVINYPTRGIGETTLGKITGLATEHGVSLWSVLCEPLTYGADFNKGVERKLRDFRELITAGIADAMDKNAYEAGTEIIRRSGILKEVQEDNSPESLSRKENIEELMNGLSDFCARRLEEGNENVGLTDFLSEVSLLTDQDSDGDGETERITLMTVHAAKGLEFRNVFVVGMEENLFPSGMAGDSPRAMEEERRLFYVAITRAEERCMLSYARSRFRFGKMEFGVPSRFLKDIDCRYLHLPQGLGTGTARADQPERPARTVPTGFGNGLPPRLKRVEAVSASPTREVQTREGEILQVGQWIEHERFGPGEVVKVEGAGDNAKATIRFEHAGVKQLLLRFARFKIVK